MAKFNIRMRDDVTHERVSFLGKLADYSLEQIVSYINSWSSPARPQRELFVVVSDENLNKAGVNIEQIIDIAPVVETW